MRTILTIDDDVLVAVEAIARQQDRSLGEVITDLARRSLPVEPGASLVRDSSARHRQSAPAG